ncbi:MAG: NUDIX domain-containing protein [Parachlamydiaceae bacterium]
MKKNISELEIHKTAPEGFSPQVQVAGCYLEIDNKLLLLQRAKENLQPGKWGVPAGKLEKDESPLNAAKRELFEETGIENVSQIQQVSALYIRKPGLDYTFYQFKVDLNLVPEVRLSHEHQNYQWATINDMENIALMEGAKEALEHYHNIVTKKRPDASVNAYLILRQGDQIFFQLRKNTGYCDGMWSLIAGHVENGESATAAMIREAREEIGIELSPEQLKVVHIIHRQTNRVNVDVFFECFSWKGTIRNCEPEKCEELAFFSLDQTPRNVVDYNIKALKAIQNHEFYSELGWNT